MFGESLSVRIARVTGASLLSVCLAQAQPATPVGPPWHEPPMVPLPANTRSLEVNEFDTPVWSAPNQGRRGSLLAGARLTILGSARRSGDCSERWFLIGPMAWVCGAHVRPSGHPSTRDVPELSPPMMPYRYYFVGNQGAFAYSDLSLVGEGMPASQLEPGFAVAVVNQKQLGGELIAYTTNGLWIPLQDLVPARVSNFEGVHISPNDEALEVGWVLGAPRYTHDRPNGKRLRRLDSRTAVRIAERGTFRGVQWCRTEQGDWVRSKDLRIASVVDPPEDLTVDERWLDIDTTTQILTAYVGERAVFTTLVSTGKGARNSDTATPIGEHRVWVKLASSDMTNVEDQQASRYYAIEAVPWVQFFKAGYGLHAAFWHDSFGTPRSHGCVNLSPKDAAFLFTWTEPRLPTGWHAVHPTPVERGTRVRVR